MSFMPIVRSILARVLPDGAGFGILVKELVGAGIGEIAGAELGVLVGALIGAGCRTNMLAETR